MFYGGINKGPSMWLALIELVLKKACRHKWNEMYKFTVGSTNNTQAMIITINCEKCGKLHTWKVNADTKQTQWKYK